MTTAKKLEYVATYLSDRTADASWMLCKDTNQLWAMEAELGINTEIVPRLYLRDAIINRMYERVLRLESE